MGCRISLPIWEYHMLSLWCLFELRNNKTPTKTVEAEQGEELAESEDIAPNGEEEVVDMVEDTSEPDRIGSGASERQERGQLSVSKERPRIIEIHRRQKSGVVKRKEERMAEPVG